MTDEEWEARKILRDGVPAELREPLIGWISGCVATEYADFLDRGLGLALRIDTDIDLGEVAISHLHMKEVLYRLRAMSEQDLLVVVDWTLAKSQSFNQWSEPGLDPILAMAASRWKSAWTGDEWRLAEVVSAGVAEAVEAQFILGAGGRLLQRAWGVAYGMSPNPTEAYRLAVRAVEASSKAVVEPGNSSSTLGTTIGRIRNDSPMWRVPFSDRKDLPDNNHDVLVRLMQTLWHGQTDRHGDARDVTLEEARAALLSAATLVGWFESGAVRQR